MDKNSVFLTSVQRKTLVPMISIKIPEKENKPNIFCCAQVGRIEIKNMTGRIADPVFDHCNFSLLASYLSTGICHAGFLTTLF